MKNSLRTFLALVGLLASSALAQNCGLADNEKVDCGYVGIDQFGCESKGCCWVPVFKDGEKERQGGTPWCFYPATQCDDINAYNWVAASPGFDATWEAQMKSLYALNLDYCGGSVVAAPDDVVNYIYHWMRDGALSIKVWMDINDGVLSAVQDKLDPYVTWVTQEQQKYDPNVDVRVEPKFEICSGDPYSGGWCRPQTDGPALRAMALSQYGMIHLDQGDPGYADRIWDLVQFDMDWVLNYWYTSGCDLWEEVTSDNFYWNRAGYVYSLHVAADFSDRLGKGFGTTYRNLADTILPTAEAHYNGAYIFEADIRREDGSVLHAIATFGDQVIHATDYRTAQTITDYIKTFCREYPINQQDLSAGLEGILIGRYPGDTYQGGNPWQLLTAALAEVFYIAAEQNFIDASINDITLTMSSDYDWLTLMQLSDGSRLSELAAAQLSAGNAVMSRLFAYVKNDGYHIDEQIDKDNGLQKSARDLTWSYANILHALHVGRRAGNKHQEFLAKKEQEK